MKKDTMDKVLATKLRGTLTDEQIRDLVRLGVPNMTERPDGTTGVVKGYPAIEEATGVNYNRGWLIIRRGFLLETAPEKLLDMQQLAVEAKAKQDAIVAQLEKELKAAKTDAEAERVTRLMEAARYDYKRHVVGAQVKRLRLELGQGISWGEISVRLDTPESTCRGAFNSVSDRKAKGLRIGRGGKFAYGDGSLYDENRKTEGAHIRIEQVMRPKPEDLINYRPKEPTKATKAKKAAPAKKAVAKTA